MLRKLAGYVLLSFLSFIVFSTLLHTVANAQSPAELIVASVPQNPSVSPYQTIPATQSPTPTIVQPQVKFKLSSIVLPSPTVVPTIAKPQPTTTMAPPPTAAIVQPIEPTATPLPTATPIPQAAVAGDLESFFTKYSAEYSVDKEDLKRIAKCEAGFNSQADTGTYAGMFQFAAQTWSSNRAAMGLDTNPDLRKNAEESIRTAAFMIHRGNRGAWPNC